MPEYGVSKCFIVPISSCILPSKEIGDTELNLQLILHKYQIFNNLMPSLTTINSHLSYFFKKKKFCVWLKCNIFKIISYLIPIWVISNILAEMRLRSST